MSILAVLELPYPPSVNTIWEPEPVLRVKVGELVRRLQAGEPWRNMITARQRGSTESKRYRDRVAEACMLARVAGELPEQPLIGVLDVRVVACPPLLNKRGHRIGVRRDSNNLWKALLDAMTNAGVILDDSQFCDDRIRWGDPVRKPFVRVALGRPDRCSDDEYLGLARPRITVRSVRPPPPATQAELL